MKGFGTDEQVIIDILCKRSNAQRQAITEMYYKKEMGRVSCGIFPNWQMLLICQLISGRLSLNYTDWFSNIWFKQDLIADLKSELSGNFEDLIVGLITPPDKYIAKQLYKAFQGIGTSEDVLVEILFSRSYEEIVNIAAAYESSITITL